MNAHTPARIEPFKLGAGRPLSAMVQEMIAREMMRDIPAGLRWRAWPNGTDDVSNRAQRRRDAIRDEAVALFKSGVPVSLISIRLNAAVDTIKKTLREAGIQPNIRKPGDAAVKTYKGTRAQAARRAEVTPEVLRLHAEGKSLTAICNKLGAGHKLVRSILLEAGE